MSLTLMLPLLLGAGFALQPPGQFHRGEPVARDGEPWLALRIDGEGAALVATRLAVRAVEDPLVDEAGERSGLEVSSADAGPALMYLRGETLQAGRIERASFDPGGAAWPLAIRFQGRPSRIERECAAQPRAADAAQSQSQFDCAIVLHGAAGRQVLVEMSGYREAGGTLVIGDAAMPRLLFAGDLDRDGRLDLIFDTSDHYNVSRPTLLLSSLAAPGALLGVAAHYQSVGC